MLMVTVFVEFCSVDSDSFVLLISLSSAGADSGGRNAAISIMSVYRLPQGQYGYSGHVVNLPQDVASFSQSLPRLLDVIVGRKEGGNQSLRDFRVRRAVVLRALQWLVTYNQYYL